MISPELASATVFALAAGVATFFSPCAYPLLPGYVAFYVNQTEGETGSLTGSVVRGIVAATGVLVTFGFLFAVSLWIGHDRLSNIELFEVIIGIVLVVFGVLVVLGREPSLTISLPKRRSSVAGFGIFGAGYALAAAGCVAPIFIAVIGLGLSFSLAGTVTVLGIYVAVIAVLMLSLTVATGMGVLAGKNTLAQYSGLVKRVAGGVMIVAGLGQLYLAIFILEVL